jgi:anti-anti-sigma factor
MDVWMPGRRRDRSAPSITVSWVWPVALVLVVGEIDRAGAAGLERRLVEALDGGAARIVVDASGLTHLDPAGVEVLARASHALRARGGTLSVVDLRPDLRRAVESSGVAGEVVLLPASR